MKDQLFTALLQNRNLFSDPLKKKYNVVMNNIKQLCDTPNITSIIISNLMNKGRIQERTMALETLTKAAT